jgi:hypothetical protein
MIIRKHEYEKVSILPRGWTGYKCIHCNAHIYSKRDMCDALVVDFAKCEQVTAPQVQVHGPGARVDCRYKEEDNHDNTQA